MDKIQKTLIKLGRRDLAQEYFEKISGKVDDEKQARSLGISLDQLNTLKKFKHDQFLTLKNPMDGEKKIRFERFDGKEHVSYSIKSIGRKGRPGRASSSIKVKEFFDMIKPRIIKYEDPDKFIDAEPTKKDITDAAKVGSPKTEYYQGGFPSTTDIVYDRNKDEKKAKKLLNRIKSREMIIRMTKAIKSIFGDLRYSGPYDMFIEKAKKLGCTDEEIKSIENYNKKTDMKINYKF